ncbi:hypothetical protein OHB01_23345 [Microbispora hainanensis]|uniref:hypothetical protein n=1 Tax=Microbispora hainanensis TaxID=568844 RepID=UPI002E2D431F|nr:hypothetical protein [Microbispora hainanensis]
MTAAFLAAGVFIVTGWRGNVIGRLCGSVPFAIGIWTRPRAIRLPDGAELSRHLARTVGELSRIT